MHDGAPAEDRRIDDMGRTALHRAILAEDNGEALRLVEQGADVNAQDKEGSTPAHLATGASHNKVLKALIDGGAELERVNNMGETALHEALRRSQPCQEIISQLLEQGLDVTATGQDGFSPLYLAVKHHRCPGQAAVIRLLLAQDKKNKGNRLERDELGGFLSIAARVDKADLEVLDALVEHGADINCIPEIEGLEVGRDVNHKTLLHQAIRTGRDDIVEWVIRKWQPDFNLRNGKGRTPLISAIILLMPRTTRV